MGENKKHPKDDESRDQPAGIERSKIYHTVSKWQKASVKLTQVKLDLENLLNEFDADERKDERYEELFKTVQFIFKNIDDHYNPAKNKKSVLDWITFKNSVIAFFGAVILLIANNIESICNFILSLFKGSH